jgi:hypothetical protein
MPLYSPSVASDASVLATAATPRFCPVSREAAQGSVTMTVGTAFFAGFTALSSATVTTLYVHSRGTASASTTLARLGLFTVDSSGSLTLVARSASDTALTSVTFTAYPKTFDTTGGYPASYTLAAGYRYALGCLWVGGTAPAIYGSATLGPSGLWLPWQQASITGQTDLATSYAIGSLVNTGSAPFLALF